MIHFHRVLISTAIVFCGGFAVWSLLSYRAAGDTVSLILFISFLLATAALAYYLANLRRFLGR